MGCGSRRGKMEQHSAGKPHVDHDICVGCGLCTKICAHSAITVENKKATIDHNKCVGCGKCIGICPRDAVCPASDESNDILNYKIAEYSKAVVAGRPAFYINMVIDILHIVTVMRKMMLPSFQMSECLHHLIQLH